MSSVLPWALLGLAPLLLSGSSPSNVGTNPPLGGTGGGTGSGGAGEPPKPISIDDGLVWAETLPKKHGPEREAAILAAVKAGGANTAWTTLTSGPIEGYRATMLVMARTLRIGKKNPVRVEVDYVTHQRICEEFAASMLTPYLSDLIWKQAKLRIPYLQKQTWVENGTMASTANMVTYSKELDAGDKNANRPPIPVNSGDMLISNEAKQWVVAKRLWVDNVSPEKSWDPDEQDTPEMAWSANYGFYQPNGVPVQSVGKMHNMVHTDYSQEYMAVHNIIVLEGPKPLGPVHYVSLLRHPVLCKLVSNEGPLPDCKHPFFGTTVAPEIPFDIV